MEEDILKKYDLNKPCNCILYLAIVLTTAGLILTFTQISKMPLARLCITILGYLLVLYYTFIGYQKPHGNLLFYLILCFGLLLLFVRAITSAGNQLVALGDFNEVILWLDIACAYCARYQQHKEAGLQVE